MTLCLGKGGGAQCNMKILLNLEHISLNKDPKVEILRVYTGELKLDLITSRLSFPGRVDYASTDLATFKYGKNNKCVLVSFDLLLHHVA